MLYKRSSKPGSHWWVRFSIKGVEVRQSSGTDRKESAEAFEQQLREAIWNEQNLGIEVHTWGEACARWYREKAHKRSLARDKQAIARLAIPESRELGDVSAASPGSDELRTGPAECGAREIAVLRSILNAAVAWGWLDRAPKVEMPHAEKHDPRWITKAQFEKLCKELPPHAAQLARFAVATGLRQSNIFRLRWDSVSNGAIRVGSLYAKAGKAIGVPLNRDAQAILKRQSGTNPVYVFTDHRGSAPIGSIKTCWHKATKRAGLEGFRFHDLRHTWAAWHVMAGTPPMILKELGGWASLAMVERYGHINPGHLADWADNSRTKTGTRRKAKKRKPL